jgi:biotin carboxylase
VDTHIASGSRVPPLLDSLLGKIIAPGRIARRRCSGMRARWPRHRIEGWTSLGLQRAVLEDARFRRVAWTTELPGAFIDARPDAPWRKGNG